MTLIQTKTFPNLPPANEGWIEVRKLRFRTVYMRYLGGTPRPDIMGDTPEKRGKIKRFGNENEILRYKNTLMYGDETVVTDIMDELVL